MIGKTIGNYRILGKVGEGGMGEVYHSIDTMVEREVAIKVLRQEIAKQPGLTERFRIEAVTLAKLNHPNVAALYSFFSENDEFYMVIEFVPGKNLEDILSKDGPMSLAVAVDILAKAMDGVAHAHDKGILHRDIKPANILVTDTGMVKVTDFGIARILGRMRLTHRGKVIGTTEYMAPERLQGLEADPRSDIYSLGAVFYQLLTGHVPFEYKDEVKLVQAHILEPPPPLSKYGKTFPKVVEDIVQKALAKSPDDRFATVSEFRKAIVAAVSASAAKETRMAVAIPAATRLASDAVEPSPPQAPPLIPAPPPPAPAFTLSAKQYAMVGVAALLLLSGLSYALFFRGPKQPIDNPIASNGPPTSAPPANEDWRSSAVPIPAPAPAQPPPDASAPPQQQPPAGSGKQPPSSPQPQPGAQPPSSSQPPPQPGAQPPSGGQPQPGAQPPPSAQPPAQQAPPASPAPPAPPSSNEAPRPSRRATIPLASVRRIYIAKMQEEFRNYLREQLSDKLKNRIRLVASEDQADAILTGIAEDKSGVGTKVTGGAIGVRNSATASVTLVDVASKGVIWSGEAGDRALFRSGGFSKVAERIVDQLKKDLAKADNDR